jgi:hypothetical protein
MGKEREQEEFLSIEQNIGGEEGSKYKIKN